MTEGRKKRKKRIKIGGRPASYSSSPTASDGGPAPMRPAQVNWNNYKVFRPSLATRKKPRVGQVMRFIALGLGNHEQKEGKPLRLTLYHNKGGATVIEGRLINSRPSAHAGDVLVLSVEKLERRHS